ncbi:unnamed protein product [Linum tenue]|uniref:Uncharacterized protein n=1 Tax=Linum tenue TaxID=586396 RepID=A0AAV0NT11_9ROSI|nr:unnamed protein product [Linum tenue]
MSLPHAYLQSLCHTHDYDAQFGVLREGTIEVHWYINKAVLKDLYCARNI